MTALKPIENRRVRAVASERYPLNKKCAHPECSEDAVDPHHGFPRSAIGGDSWFVSIEATRQELDADPFRFKGLTFVGLSGSDMFTAVIPHVTGLCRAHHDAVEIHDAWIKLEDGEWRWYDRWHKTAKEGEGLRIERGAGEEGCPPERECNEWELLGPLNPQPGSVEGRAKRKRHQGQARRKRTTISIKVPKDEQEDGAGLLDEAIERLEARIRGYGEGRPVYYTIMDALNYAILNSGPEDFS